MNPRISLANNRFSVIVGISINKSKHYLLIIRNEKVGCSIHLSGTNKPKPLVARQGAFSLSEVFFYFAI